MGGSTSKTDIKPEPEPEKKPTVPPLRRRSTRSCHKRSLPIKEEKEKAEEHPLATVVDDVPTDALKSRGHHRRVLRGKRTPFATMTIDTEYAMTFVPFSATGNMEESVMGAGLGSFDANEKLAGALRFLEQFSTDNGNADSVSESESEQKVSKRRRK